MRVTGGQATSPPRVLASFAKREGGTEGYVSSPPALTSRVADAPGLGIRTVVDSRRPLSLPPSARDAVLAPGVGSLQGERKVIILWPDKALSVIGSDGRSTGGPARGPEQGSPLSELKDR